MHVLGPVRTFVAWQVIPPHGSNSATGKYSASHYITGFACIKPNIGDTLHASPGMVGGQDAAKVFV